MNDEGLLCKRTKSSWETGDSSRKALEEHLVESIMPLQKLLLGEKDDLPGTPVMIHRPFHVIAEYIRPWPQETRCVRNSRGMMFHQRLNRLMKETGRKFLPRKENRVCFHLENPTA